MPDWQERITHDTRPTVRTEHVLRYALAVPAIRASARWCDLGCGTGLGAAQAFGGDAYDGTALLVDVEQALVDGAAAAIEARETVALVADLSDPAAIQRVRDALSKTAPKRARGAATTVTCFEVIEHLQSFAPLVALLVELAEQPATTVVLSVPNDAFWSIDNPHHPTTWGEGAVEELRTMLPADHLLLHQVALSGSAIVPAGATASVAAEAAVAPGVASHFLIAFGAGAAQLAGGAPSARVVQADVEGQRRWERQRESDLLYYATSVRALEARLAAAGAAADAAPEDGDVEAADAPAANGHA